MNGYTVAGEILELIESQHDGDHSPRKQAMIEHLQDQMATEFGKLRGWKRSKARLRRGNMRTMEEESIFGDLQGMPRVDHPWAYWCPETRRHIVASHDYDCDARRQADNAAFAARNNLIVEYPGDFPSWWYPGSTTLVLWRQIVKPANRKAA